MAEAAPSFEPSAISEIVEGLSQAVAETAVTTMKAQNFHWNVTGMAFGPLHELFQKIYEDHFEGQDTLAERVKALGAHAEGRLSVMIDRSAVNESDGKLSAEAMVEELAGDQETLSITLRSLAGIADKHGDVVTNDLAVERADVHDKFAWFLRAHLR